jgi:hypothetical protein
MFPLLAIFALLLMQSDSVPGAIAAWRPAQSMELNENETLSNLKINAVERTSLASAIESHMRQTYRLESADAMQMRTRALRSVGSDHRRFILVQATSNEFCGATGNCTLMIYEKFGSQYRCVFTAVGQTLTVLDTVSGGYPLLLVAIHESASERSLQEYRYLGGRYRSVACYDYQAADPDTNEGVTTPTIVKIPHSSHC